MTIGTVGGGNRETRWAGTGTSPEGDIHSSIVPVKVTSATEPAMPQRIRCLGADGSGSGSDGGGNSSGNSSGSSGMPGSTKTPGANCSVDDFAIEQGAPGAGRSIRAKPSHRRATWTITRDLMRCRYALDFWPCTKPG